MKRLIASSLFAFLYASGMAQVGVGTTSPHSTLDVRGSMSSAYRSFTSNTTAAISDNMLVFTGSSATTLTLPTAASVQGRYYWIKNATSNTSVLTIATTSSQTIDGASSWSLDPNEGLRVVSNGTNWYVVSETMPGSSGQDWVYNGNAVPSLKKLGTTSNYDLPFITNNVERMRISTAGNVAVGTSSFNGTYPEKFLVDAGTTTSYNVISGKGTIDNYLQLNIQNNSSGTAASSDVVATADNGNETTNFVDMGINSSNYSSTGILGGINTAYLYSTGRDFSIGNASASRNLLFFTGGTATTNERMRITSAGNVGINTTSPTEKLQVEGNLRFSGYNRAIFFDADTDPYAGIKAVSRTGEINELMLFSGNDVTGSYGPDRIRLATHEIHFATSSSAGTINSGDPAAYYESSTNVPTRMLINEDGNVSIGSTASFNSTNPEQLLVDAGSTSSFNVISGKGSINNYLQLNIQNNSTGSSASSDVVATADNGTESVNFVDMGINSSNYSSSGVLGGANNAYLYATGNNFIIGNASSGKDVLFFTGGTNTSNEKMRITTTAIQPGTDNSVSMGTSSKRWSVVYAANGTIQTSDVRLKKNILPLSYGLAEVMKLQPVSYDWKDDSGHKIGLIAQEVKKVIPEVVVGDESKEKLGMNYAELVPVLVNAIKEMKNELQQAKKEIEQLKKQINK